MRPTPASASSHSNSTNRTATVRSHTSCRTQNRLALSHPLASQQRDRISPRSSTTMVALLPTRDQGTTAEVKARVTRLPSEPNDDVAILPLRYTLSLLHRSSPLSLSPPLPRSCTCLFLLPGCAQ